MFRLPSRRGVLVPLTPLLLVSGHPGTSTVSFPFFPEVVCDVGPFCRLRTLQTEVVQTKGETDSRVPPTRNKKGTSSTSLVDGSYGMWRYGRLISDIERPHDCHDSITENCERFRELIEKCIRGKSGQLKKHNKYLLFFIV